MQLTRSAFYIVLVLLFLGGIAGLLRVGADLEPRASRASMTAPDARAPSTNGETTSGPAPRFDRDLSRLLLQIVVIVLLARILGRAAERLRQPPVVGEIVAGILLGPSLLGSVFPRAALLLFPPTSLGTLRLFAEIGIVLFMFGVGLDLDVLEIASKARAAVAVSHASILVPSLLAVALSLFLYPAESSPSVSFRPFALFMAIAMSITAFPVLARILEERGLARTSLGNLAITCAAVDDVTAWSLLAVVVAIAAPAGVANATSTVVTLALVALYAAAMLFAVRPLLSRLVRVSPEAGAGGRGTAAALLFGFASALATESIGIHPLFGAFLAGAVTPRAPALRAALKERLEGFGALLLPLFFAVTGLRTRVGLLSDLPSWLLCAAVILVATAGKLGGSFLAARWSGLTPRDSFALGALMNTRGLVELVVLNVGYDLGILSPRIFAMMVSMALATTLLTGPLLSLAAPAKQPIPLRERARPGLKT